MSNFPIFCSKDVLLINFCLESNEVLKLKFEKLQKMIISCVNPASIMDFLFQEDVIGADDMGSLLRFRDDPQQRCKELLTLLHESENPQAFVQLYTAIKAESHLQWLTDRIGNQQVNVCFKERKGLSVLRT